MTKRVFKNGKIFTANDKQLWAEAVVTDGNKIVYVGDNAGAESYESGAQVQDLGGKLMTPGIIDGHIHTFAAIVFDGVLRLDGLQPEEMLAKIREDVEAHPERPAYTGLGWQDDIFGAEGPNKAMLDEICADKPIAYLSASMHCVWCNSKALEVADVNKDTPDIDPDAGVLYVRDENGEPTGYCKEIASMDKVMSATKYVDDSILDEATDRFMQLCTSNGLTSVVDCAALSFLKYMFNDLLNEWVDSDECKLRLNFCGFAGVAGLYETAFDASVDFNKRFNNDRFFGNFYKLFNDGTLESGSAAIPKEYPGGKTVKPILTVEALAEKFEECAKEGINVNIHAVGPNAVHNVLEAAGVVREKGYKDIRIVCSHGSYVYKQDIELFAKNDVFLDTTGLWITATDEEQDGIVSYLTEAEAYPVKSIIEAGGMVGFGSDFPTDPTAFPPLQNFECLVTRKKVGEADGYLHNGAECLSVEEVLKGYTINNAYQMGKEDVLGSIEVGKYADLAIFEQNLFEVEPHTIHDVKVAETIKDGLTTYKM